MNGSAFPKDIYVLLMKKYLDSADALSLSMTCPRLYKVFSPFERFYMKYGYVPPKFAPPVPIVEEEWTTCDDCHTTLKKKSLLNHYVRKKCKMYVKQALVCKNCMTSVEITRYLTHVVRCKGRYEAETCSKCQTRHSMIYCAKKLTQCKYCKRKIPLILLHKKKYCEICDAVVSSGKCFLCKPKRCYSCKEEECPCCHELIDPFGESPHKCPSTIGAILQRFGKDLCKILYRKGHGGWYHVDYEDYYLANAIDTIPPIERRAVTRVFLPNGMHILSFRGPGDFMWRIKPAPPHCANCATTAKLLFDCKKCGLVRYCGERCVEMHLGNHKTECLDCLWHPSASRVPE